MFQKVYYLIVGEGFVQAFKNSGINTPEEGVKPGLDPLGLTNHGDGAWLALDLQYTLWSY